MANHFSEVSFKFKELTEVERKTNGETDTLPKLNNNDNNIVAINNESQLFYVDGLDDVLSKIESKQANLNNEPSVIKQTFTTSKVQ